MPTTLAKKSAPFIGSENSLNVPPTAALYASVLVSAVQSVSVTTWYPRSYPFYIHAYIHTHLIIHAYVHAHMHTCIHTYIHTVLLLL